MKAVIVWSVINLSFVFSATISEWDNGNIDLPEPFEFETVRDIMSFLENNFRKDTNFETTTSMSLEVFNEVFYLHMTHQKLYFKTLISI